MRDYLTLFPVVYAHVLTLPLQQKSLDAFLHLFTFKIAVPSLCIQPSLQLFLLLVSCLLGAASTQNKSLLMRQLSSVLKLHWTQTRPTYEQREVTPT